MSEGSHRSHEFKLCSSVAPSLRSNLRDTLDRVRSKRESASTRLGALESRGDEQSYIGPREAIARHCSELRSAVDELETRLLRDVNFFMRDSVGVASLRDELTDLDDFEGRCVSFERYNAVDLCVLVSSLALYESNLRLSMKDSSGSGFASGTVKESKRGETMEEVDLERGGEATNIISASVEDKLDLKLEMTPKLLESICHSGAVHITRQPSAYEVRLESCLSLFRYYLLIGSHHLIASMSKTVH